MPFQGIGKATSYSDYGARRLAPWSSARPGSRCCCTFRRWTVTAPHPRVKNGPATAGHGAEAVRDSIAATITTLPAQLRKTLTWDQGAEMAQHAQLRVDTGLAIYFCDPRSPWQRGTDENTNGLLRQYFPKGTDLTKHSATDLQAVAMALNTRPRKTLDWRTPAEALNHYLLLLQPNGVATTP